MNSVKNALELSKFVNISHVEPKNVLLFSTEPVLFLPLSSGRIDLKFDKYYYSQEILNIWRMGQLDLQDL